MIKVKKTFSERWVKRLVDNWNGIISMLHGTFVCHDKLNDAMEEVMDYVFTTAKASKLTPKQFAKIVMDKEALHEYGSKVVDAMMDAHIKQLEKEDIAAGKEAAKQAKKAK